MLLSGNGRHRRPRPTPKFVVAAGVTGAGMAIPIIGASSANAASASTWERVAECESGSDWSANTGNGYFGGLQMSQEIWDAFGGREFAPRPDLASRSEQIAVAERVLAERGPEVWPSCSLTAGLARAEAEVKLPTDLPAPSESFPGASPGADETGPGASEDRGEADGGDGTATPDPSASGSPEPTVEEPDPQRTQDAPSPEYGQDWSPAPQAAETIVLPEQELIMEPAYVQYLTGSGGEDAEASSAADENTDGGEDGPGKKPAGEGRYTVAPGDSLAGIAQSQDVPGGWEALYEMNRDTIGGDPNQIVPGQELRIR